MAKVKEDREALYKKLKKGDNVFIKRKKPKKVLGFPYYALLIFREIVSIDREKQKILCDDNINYKFKDIDFN